MIDSCGAAMTQVLRLLKAIGNAPHGGQILIDATTFAAVSSSTQDVARLLPQRPDFESLAKFARSR